MSSPHHSRGSRTASSPIRRAVSLATASALAATAFLAGVPTVASADPADPEVPQDGLVTEYLFNAETKGDTVLDTVSQAPATVHNDADDRWTDTSLILTGGAKTGDGTWVELPDDILQGADAATITTEVRFDPTMKSNWNFLWNIGSNSQTHYLFTSVKDNPRATIKAGGGEINARAAAPLNGNQWYSLTTVVDGTSIAFYVDGVEVARTVTDLTPASITDQSLNTIGRAPYPDPLFKGEVSSFRVYDRALDAAEVNAISLSDVRLNPEVADASAAAAQAAVDAIDSLTFDDATATLPGGPSVSWTSADPNLVIAEDGRTVTVRQPASGDPAAVSELTATASVRGIQASRQVPVTINPSPADDDGYGYLMVHFVEDSAGYAEKIYLDVSRGNNPEQWDPLNGRQPILASHLGTTGVRDPYITKDDKGTYYIIATDLRVFGGDKGGNGCVDWCHWSQKGSTDLIVWTSTDLVNWSEPAPIQLQTPEAPDMGMAWAPEATWVDDLYGDEGGFVVYWSSKLDQGGTWSPNTIQWATTKDFTNETYQYGGTHIGWTSGNIDMTVTQNGDTTYRTVKNEGGAGIFTESTTAKEWWSAGDDQWTRVQSNIGQSRYGAVEGPATFKVHGEDRWYLFVDDLPQPGYQPMVSEDLDAGWEYLDSPDYYLAPMTKHGGILPLTKAEYDRVRAADLTGAVAEDLGEFAIDEGGTSDDIRALLPDTAQATLAYGRGTADVPVEWDVATVDPAQAGTYTVTGTLRGLGANLNDWVGEGGSTAWNAADREPFSATAVNVTATVVVNGVVTPAGPQPVLRYSFDGEPTGALADGATITDVSDGSFDGTVRRTGAQIVAGISGDDGALRLPGGSASSTTAPYVDIAAGVLDGDSTDVTLSAWMKWDGAQVCAWPMTLGRSNNQYLFYTPNCHNGKAAEVKSGSVANNAVDTTGVQATGEWVNVAAVLSGGDTLSLYVDGVLVKQSATAHKASVAAGTATLSGMLGKSFYNDPYWAGVMDEFRVYDQALSAAEVIAAATDTAGGEREMLRKDAARLSVPGIATDHLTLPQAGLVGQVTWSSDKPGVIAADGTVVRGDDAESVVLTATLTGPTGQIVTREFTVSVPAAESITQIARSLTVASVIEKGYALPGSASGAAVTWSVASGDAAVEANVVTTAPAGGFADVVLRATVTRDDQTATTEIPVRVIEEGAESLAAYTTSRTTRNVDDPELTRTGHLALSADGASWEALNTGAGIVFPEVSGMTEFDNGTKQYMRNPHLFRLEGDQGWGMVAERTNSAGVVRESDKGAVLVFTSPDGIQWREVGMLKLADAHVSGVVAEWDARDGAYRVIWTPEGGAPIYGTTADFASVRPIGPVTMPPARTTSIAVDHSENAMVVPVTTDEARTLRNLLGRVSNTDCVQPDAVSVTVGDQLDLPEKVTANYTDGGTHDFRVEWDQSQVDMTQAGTYEVTGTLQQTLTQFPMIARRADPHVLRYERGDGIKKWLFISTDDNGQDEFFVRESDTLEGISTAQDHRILGYGLNGSSVNSQLWAPEFHEVDGDLYILFAANAENANWWAGVQSYTMRLKPGGNPIVREDWEAPQRVVDQAGEPLTTYGSGITLDMTYFKDGDTEYVMWSERQVNPNKPAVLKIATVQSSKTGAWQLTSDRVLVALPNDGWSDNTTEVVEGPFAIQRDGKVMITFSGSGVDSTYAVGLLTATAGDDLLDPANWQKKSYPIWSNEGAFANNWGPGHNSYTYDDDGNLINVFHAKVTSNGSRDSGARMVYFRADGSPILDMTDEEWLKPDNRTVTLTVTVSGKQEPPTGLITGISAVLEPSGIFATQAFDPDSLTLTAALAGGGERVLVRGVDYELTEPVIDGLGEKKGLAVVKPGLLSPDYVPAEGEVVAGEIPVVVTVGTEQIRYSGRDRYLTSQDVATQTMEQGRPVFVVSGTAYADALVAAPAAAKVGGSVVFTKKNMTDLSMIRLIRDREPSEVYVVGGTSVISNLVDIQLRTALGVDVQRIAGTDRYATAAALAEEFYGGGADGVVIASGYGLTDALTGSVVAGQNGWPVLFAADADPVLPEPTRTVLAELEPEQAVIAGGAQVVHPDVELRLEETGVGAVERDGGKDRYETAALVSKRVIPSGPAFADTGVVVVNGEAPADALAYAHIAATKGWAIQLSRLDCVPDASSAAIAPEHATRVVVGGTQVVKDNVLEELTRCS